MSITRPNRFLLWRAWLSSRFARQVQHHANQHLVIACNVNAPHWVQVPETVKSVLYGVEVGLYVVAGEHA